MQTLAMPARPEPNVQEDVSGALNQIRSMEITTHEDELFANTLLREVVKQKDSLVEQRGRGTKPLDAALKEIRSWFKPILDMLQDAENTLKGKIGTYQLVQQKAQQELFLAAQSAHQAGDEGQTLAALKSAQAADVEKLDGTGVRWFWDVEKIEDPAAVPRIWLCPDVESLKTMAKAHKGDEAPQVPGVRFFQHTVVSVRR